MPPVVKKKARKKEIESEVDVQERLDDLKETFRKKQQVMLKYAALVLVIIIAGASVYFYRWAARDKAQQLEYEAYKFYYNEHQKNPLPRPEQLQKALDLFKEAYAKEATPRMLWYIANAQYDLARHDEAIATLQDLLKQFSSDKDITPLACNKLAMIQLKQGKKEEALKSFDALYGLASPIYKDVALIQSARILEGEGKSEEANKKYRELAEKHQGSPYAEEAKAKLGQKKEG